MAREAELTARAREILHSIVKCYIETGEPVASRTVARGRREPLSPATVRNLMVDLDEAGYLEQPHPSAGRVPTEKAFRLYAQALLAGRLPALPVERFHAQLSELDSPANRIERCCHLLTEFTHNVGIAAAIPTAAQTLDRVELLKLADRRILMIVITRDGTVRDRVVWMDEELSFDDLTSLCNYVNENFSGWVLAEARRELEARLRQESAAYDAILSRLLELYGKGLLDIDAAAEIHLEGASNLVALDPPLTRQRMRELLRALEEKKRILELLDRFLERPAGELGVQVGLGEAHPSMKALSLIGLHVLLPGGLLAKIAVLGPLRMNYERAMSAVLHMGNALQHLPC
jgi:heat-inducible transcriptional repressor